MPEYLHPGVYIEEIERGPRPIEGVPTSTAAFLGETERGPVAPTLVTSHQEYRRRFGDLYAADKFLPDAVGGFFTNGGKRLFVCRLVGAAATTAQAPFGDWFAVRASGPGLWGARIFVRIDDSSTMNSTGTPVGFRIRLAYWSAAADLPLADPFDPANRSQPAPQIVEDYDDLVTDEQASNFFGKYFPLIDLGSGEERIGAFKSPLGVLVRRAGAPVGARPANGAVLLSGGADDPRELEPDDYDGLPAGNRIEPQGLAALERDPCREVALVYAPAVSNDTALKLIDHCERMKFRFAVIDAPQAQPAHALDPRTTLPADTSHAAFYFPWIAVSGAGTGAPRLVPPGGHALGVYARTDVERGVFKAPANEVVRGAIGLEFEIDDSIQNLVNPRGVNAIRRFPGRGIRIWGARTLSSNALWKYVPVRRLFIYLERSIYEATQWAVFEPNDARLWMRVTDQIRVFLRTEWRRGALHGQTEREAFFITCDERVMTQDDILNGRLICEIGVAPVRPAEFVIFRIVQHTAEAQA